MQMLQRSYIIWQTEGIVSLSNYVLTQAAIDTAPCCSNLSISSEQKRTRTYCCSYMHSW